MSVITAKDLYSLNQENLIKPSDEGWWDITSNEYNIFKNRFLYVRTYITCAFLIKLHVEEDLDDSAWDYYVLYYGNLGDTFDTNTAGSYYDGSSYYAIYEVYMKPTVRAWKYEIPDLFTGSGTSSSYTKNQIEEGQKFSYNVFLFGCKWLDRSSDTYIADYSSLYGFIQPKQNSYVVFKTDSGYYIFKLSKGQNYYATLEDGITIVGFWSQLETSDQCSLNKISDQLYSYLERNYKITSYNKPSNDTRLVIKTYNNSKYLFYADPSKISNYEESFSTQSLIDSLDSAVSSSNLDEVLGDTSYQVFIAFQSSMKYFYSTEYIPSDIYPDNLSQLKCFYTIEDTLDDNKYFFLNEDVYLKQGETGFLSNGTITRKIKSLSEITLSSYTIKKQTPYFQEELLFTDLSSSQQQQAFPTKIWPYKKVSDGVYKSRQWDKDNSSCIIGPYTNFYLYSNEIKLPLYHKITGPSKIYNQLTEEYSDVEKTSYTNLYSDSIYSSCVPCYKWKEKYLKYFGSQSQSSYSFNYKYKDPKNFINLTTNNPEYLGLTSLSGLDGQVYKKPKEDASYSGSDRFLTIGKEDDIITITEEEEDLSTTSYKINFNNEKIIIAIKSSEYTKELLTDIYSQNIPAATFPTTIEEYQNKYFGAYSCRDSTIYKHRTYNWQAYRQNSPSWSTHKYSLWSGNSLMDVPSFSWTLDANENLSNLLGLYVNSYYEFYELIPEKLESNQTLYLEANSTIPDYLKKVTNTGDIDIYKKAFGIETKIYEKNEKLDFETVKVPSTSTPAFEKTWSNSGDYRFYVPSTNLYLSGQIEYTDITPSYTTSVTAQINKNMTSSTQDFSILNYWFNIKFNLVVMPMRRISLVNPYVNYTGTSPNTKPIWDRSTDFYVGGNKACLNRPYGANISTPIRNTGFNIGINFSDSTISSQDFMPNQRCPWGLLSVLK